MIMRFLLSIFILTLLLFSTLNADNTQKVSDPVDQAVNQASNEEAMLEMLGYMTVYRDGLKELGFGANEAEAIARGLKKALSDEVIDPSYQERMGEFKHSLKKESMRLKQSEKKSRLNNFKTISQKVKSFSMVLLWMHPLNQRLQVCIIKS